MDLRGLAWDQQPDEPYWFMIGLSLTTLTHWLFKKTLLKVSREKNYSPNHPAPSMHGGDVRLRKPLLFMEKCCQRSVAPCRLRLLCNFMSSVAQWGMRLSSIWTCSRISSPPSGPKPHHVKQAHWEISHLQTGHHWPMYIFMGLISHHFCAAGKETYLIYTCSIWFTQCTLGKISYLCLSE